MGVHSLQNYSTIDPIDSTGSLYLQKYTNLPLDTSFLKIHYLTYSERKTSAHPTSHNVSTSSHESSSFHFEHSDFILLLLIGLFSIVAYIRLVNRTYFKRLWMSVFNYSYTVSFFKEKNLGFVFFNYLCEFVFYISGGILISLISTYYGLELPIKDESVKLLVITLVFAVLVNLQKIFIWLTGYIFGFYRITNEYLFYYGTLSKLMGIFFLVIGFITYFLERESQAFFIYLIFFTVGSMFIIRTLRVVLIFFTNKISLYYLILYFCALEIIPVLLLVKLSIYFFKNSYSLTGMLV
jgi:hypothetical protein